MIAPKDNPVGRNQPCPCGSGEKYKRCCANPRTKALREELVRQRVLVHLFLTQLQKLTGAASIGVPFDVLQSYPAKPALEILRDPLRQAFKFRAVPPAQAEIIAPRRIVVP